jgi:hypothetical protein
MQLKKTFIKNMLFIGLLISLFSCKAQQIIVPIYRYGDYEYEHNSNYYFKDVDNDLNKFIGTWKCETIDTLGQSVTIVIKLKVDEQYQLDERSDYEDLLVGEYQYMVGGNDIVNTLPDFDNPSVSGYGHKIVGNGIFNKFVPPKCNNCGSDERRVRVGIYNPTKRWAMGKIFMRYINDNGIEKMEAFIWDESGTLYPETNPMIDIPEGNYIFIKQ